MIGGAVLSGTAVLPDPGGLQSDGFLAVALAAFVALAVWAYLVLDVVSPRGCSEMRVSLWLGGLVSLLGVCAWVWWWPATDPWVWMGLAPVAGCWRGRCITRITGWARRAGCGGAMGVWCG